MAARPLLRCERVTVPAVMETPLMTPDIFDVRCHCGICTCASRPAAPSASARSVTRYRTQVGTWLERPDGGPIRRSDLTDVCLWAEVAPVLTALAEQEQENEQLRQQLHAVKETA